MTEARYGMDERTPTSTRCLKCGESLTAEFRRLRMQLCRGCLRDVYAEAAINQTREAITDG